MAIPEINQDVLIIQGISENGDVLRPSDWVERISSILANFDNDHRLKYSRSVQPCIVDGEKCLVVARGLEESNPDAYQFILQFALSNSLRIFADRRKGKRALKL
ncbi:MAG: DUF3579 domain-containing protein [Gammaproteobacteria bacterium]